MKVSNVNYFQVGGYNIELGGGLIIAVIIVGNGIGGLSSKVRRSRLRFTSH